jgi:putative hydrolase of the HAD superfamily
MTTKHLFFDLDRTLWDFERNSEIALAQLFHALHLHERIESFEEFHAVYKVHNARLWKEYGTGRLKKEELRNERFRVALAHFQSDQTEIVQQLSDGYIELSPKQTALFPFAIETLSDLKKEGFRLHIITNGFKEVQFTKLGNSGLLPFFDIIICSEDVGKNKPDPAIFHHALSCANAQAQHSVMIGDDYEIDILGALNAGMHAIFFDPTNQFNHYNEPTRITRLNEIPERLPWILR